MHAHFFDSIDNIWMLGISCLMLWTDNLWYDVRRQSFDSMNNFVCAWDFRTKSEVDLVSFNEYCINIRHFREKKEMSPTIAIETTILTKRILRGKNFCNFLRQLTFSSILYLINYSHAHKDRIPFGCQLTRNHFSLVRIRVHMNCTYFRIKDTI